MSQIGESIVQALIDLFEGKYLFVDIVDVTFESGITIFDVEAGGAERQLPAAGKPHWDGLESHPAVYVREGGDGETKTLKVKVAWSQGKHDGSAKLKGESSNGLVIIEGDFNISGERGQAVVNCTFTKRPPFVADYGRGLTMTWTVTASGTVAVASGAGTLKLFFVDRKPKPISWGYKKHYLKVIAWACQWAAGKAGEDPVFKALWSEFSEHGEARVPHATGFSYWKTDNPVQDLKTLIAPDGGADQRGWSCKAIAHLFMECLALHGIQCVEVIPNMPGGTQLFLVHNWDVRTNTVPNWESSPDLYYAGSWVDTDKAPLAIPQRTTLTKEQKAGPTTELLEIDMSKMEGVPGQGQSKAPLGFENHWIVLTKGNLYDTSYGAKHPNSIVVYELAALAGWLIRTKLDHYQEAGPTGKMASKPMMAWLTHEITKHTLQRFDGAKN